MDEPNFIRGNSIPNSTGDVPLVPPKNQSFGGLDCMPANAPTGLYGFAENHQKSKARLTQ